MSVAAFPELHLYVDAEPHSAAMNMAIDEALLEQSKMPALRFYRWEKPAVSFGYFGRFSDVVAQGDKRDLVRRWTGGGIVMHGTDCTYSVVLPRSGNAPPENSRAIYHQIHLALCAALQGRVPAELAVDAAPNASEFCFAKAVLADVLVDGQKIAGAAHRRTRAGMLHQGSVQYADLPADFPNLFATSLASHPQTRPLTDALQQRAKVLAAEKYATPGWLRRR